jgi:hypothetical protein
MFKKEHFKVILPCYRVSASRFKLKLLDDLLASGPSSNGP